MQQVGDEQKRVRVSKEPMSLVIASQAIITGCFSLVSQAASLGFCLPLRVYHTSEKVLGQIYVPVSVRKKEETKQDRCVALDNQLDVTRVNLVGDHLLSKLLAIDQCVRLDGV